MELSLLESVRRLAPDVPVVFATAYAEPGLRQQVLKRGAFSLLEKPFHRDELLVHVRSALRAAKIGARRGDHAEIAEPRSPSPPAGQADSGGVRPPSDPAAPSPLLPENSNVCSCDTPGRWRPAPARFLLSRNR